jgi:hypothetical protein
MEQPAALQRYKKEGNPLKLLLLMAFFFNCKVSSCENINFPFEEPAVL